MSISTTQGSPSSISYTIVLKAEFSGIPAYPLTCCMQLRSSMQSVEVLNGSHFFAVNSPMHTFACCRRAGCFDCIEVYASQLEWVRQTMMTANMQIVNLESFVSTPLLSGQRVLYEATVLGMLFDQLDYKILLIPLKIYQQHRTRMPKNQQQKTKVPFRVFKSCLLPNEESFRQARPQIWEQKSTSTTIKSALTSKEMQMCYLISAPIIILIAILYIYVTFEPIALPQQPNKHDLEVNQHAKSKATAECFSQFRLNKCSLDKPTGQVCLNLHRCITDQNLQTQNIQNNGQVASSKNSKTVGKNKLETIEELFENILLFVVGALTLKMTKHFKDFHKFTRWLKVFTEKFRGFSPVANRHYQ